MQGCLPINPSRLQKAAADRDVYMPQPRCFTYACGTVFPTCSNQQVANGEAPPTPHSRVLCFALLPYRLSVAFEGRRQELKMKSHISVFQNSYHGEGKWIEGLWYSAGIGVLQRNVILQLPTWCWRYWVSVTSVLSLIQWQRNTSGHLAWPVPPTKRNWIICWVR